MTKSTRVTSEIIRVRGHFLVKLTDFQWAMAKHGIAAGEAFDDDTIRLHLSAVSADLTCILEGAHLLGFGKLADHADQTKRMIDLFLARCLGTANATKLLTDVILDLNKFVTACRKLTEQTTVLESIDIPILSDRIAQDLDRKQA